MTEKLKKREKLAQLPQVDRLLGQPEVVELIQHHPRSTVLEATREVLSLLREKILAGGEVNLETGILIQKIKLRVEQYSQPSLRRAINATGIILHTNMGRAPLSAVAKKALAEVAENYCNLEVDLNSGKRGVRYSHVEALICRLTGAEAALVVNNNAAATLLVIQTLANDRECIISRGELITIGDSFRLPEIMKHGGAKMIEVGSTNQTRLSDYEQALTEQTALLMKVHTSNYKIIGFTAEASLPELVELGCRTKLPVYHDVGSGALLDLSRFGLPKEPVIRESIAAGADVVSFSGDKLIGGPQSGIIVGRQDLIQRMKKNQLTRALRAGKLTYAALEATLRLFLDEENLIRQHPVLQMLTRSPEIIAQSAQKIVKKTRKSSLEIKIEKGLSEIGGGSLPAESLPTRLISLTSPDFSAEQLAAKLRANQPPIVSRIQNNRVCLDLRTVRGDEVELIIQALLKISQNSVSGV